MTGDATRLSRRGVLALAGSALAAGCGGLGDLAGSDSPTIDGDDLRAAVAGDPPAVPETVPVGIADAHLDAAADRARDLLASVPHPLDAGDVPNEAARQHLSHVYERAESALDAAAAESSPFERLARLRRARGQARAAAAGWAAVEGDASFADLRAEAESIRSDVAAFRREWWYAGDSPVPAVVVHAATEDLVGSAVRRTGSVLDPRRDRRETPVTVGERAESVEGARASLADARHLFERQVASTDDPSDLRAAFDAAGRSLADRVAERRRDLPDGDPHSPSSFVGRDVEDTPAGAALEYQWFRLDRDVERGRETGRLATVVVAALRTLADVRAFEALVRQVERGEHRTVADADDVRALREDAVSAVEAAAESGRSALTNAVLARVAERVEDADDRLADHADGDEMSVAWLARELGVYVQAAAVARAAPQASATVAEALRDAA